MRNLSMIILAGGKSSRMGSNKADLLYQGRSFLQIQAEKALPLDIPEVVISGYTGCQQLPYPIVPDAEADKGPLGGLLTCFQAVHNDRALILSVDAPLVPVAELENLIRLALSGSAPAVITRCADREYPLVAVYHRSLLPHMREELHSGRGSVFSMLRRAGCSAYESKADPALFANVNDPAAYAKLQGL